PDSEVAKPLQLAMIPWPGKNGSATGDWGSNNRVQPAEESPVKMGDAGRSATNVSGGTLVADASVNASAATGEGGGGGGGSGSDPPIRAFRTATATRHTWQILAKAAVLVRSMNPKDKDVIDIYHDPTKGTSRYMIHPNSRFRRIWDYFTAFLVLYVCVMVPLVIGFTYKEWNELSSLDTFIDVYFIVDMFVTVRTGIFSNGEVILDWKVVVKRYFHFWFWVDFVSNFPLALFVQSSARKGIKIVKLQKLPKLLRFGRLLKYLRQYAKYYHLILSFIGLLMGLHMYTCIWANVFATCYDPDDNSTHGYENCTNEDLPTMYIQSMHMVLLMFLGISDSSTFVGIAKLDDPREHGRMDFYLLSLAIVVVGMIFSSFFFGNMLALLMSWDQQSAQFRNRMDIISAEMRYYELPEELQHRVRRNYDYLWINQRAYSEMMLLNQPGISKTLRTTIALHLYKDLVKTVPFFAGSDSRFLGKVCLALETAVYLPGDTIIFMDDIGKEMFIVRKGLVEIIIPEPGNTDKRIYLRDGNFFGETALVIDVRRTNTVRAVNICDLNVLSKTSFNEIVAEYPEFGERMKRTVIKRQLDNMNIQSPVEKMKIQNQLNMVVEKSLKARRMSVSLRTIYRAKKLGDKLKEIADRAAKANAQTGRKLSRRLTRMTPPPPSSSRPGGTMLPVPRTKLLHSHSQGYEADRHTTGRPGFRTGSLPESENTPPARQTMISQSSPPLVQFQLPLVSLNGALSRQESSGRSAILPPLARTGRQPQIDAVSRRLSKAEVTMDLIPTALLEITEIVNQIKRTTDRLNRRLHTTDTSDVSDDEADMDDADNGSDITVGMDNEDGSTEFPPLNEETDEEVNRRESNSIVSAHARQLSCTVTHA
ncbi:TPA: hypothetical protein N0F65_011282, partial [Lagenidium giganteum]